MVAFALIILVSLVWITLLSVEISVRWDISDPSQRSLVGVLIIVNSITTIMLPSLVIAEFRIWLDAARLLFLLLIHIGTAALYSSWNAGFRCPDQNLDAQGVCRLIDMYILIGTWVIPAMLLAYSSWSALVYYKYPQCLEAMIFSDRRESVLPIMSPSMERRQILSSTFSKSVTGLSHPSSNTPIQPHTEPGERRASSRSGDSGRPSGRLSKGLPRWLE
ncbi:hypothetical protein CERSUDRAFT_64702 [Gelatoporia subvermispora B]|uniref:MARVEL domain-containing protein n=1 Tax=Ceriporiopsis subvermispora (strain B) TaxID=914234 RepID=M2PPL9_CERS8|nr:hypothetical protein CERSUDRAFT_64702 [Gelatoporia subvermispora B]